MLKILSLFAFCWAFPAAAVIGHDSTAPEALAVRFPHVVLLRSRVEICTGTIVGPRVVLSAAHCASLGDTHFVYNGKRYDVKFTASADYRSKEHDLAVALTQQDIVGARFAEIGSGVKHGSELTLAGFGCTTRGGKSGALHIGLTKVIGMDKDHVLSFSTNGGVLCQGDSGGPAFLREGNKDFVVAINSAGDIKNINLNVRLDSPLSRHFLQRIASRFRVAVCGITMGCESRRERVASWHAQLAD